MTLFWFPNEFQFRMQVHERKDKGDVYILTKGFDVL